MRASVRVRLNPEVLKKTCTVAEHEVAVQAERDCRRYIPSRTGKLRSCGKVESNYIVWDMDYAKIQYFGHMLVDPVTKVAGFPIGDGQFRSRRGVTKIRSNRKFAHANGGPMWFTKAKEANRAKWLAIARRYFKK